MEKCNHLVRARMLTFSLLLVFQTTLHGHATADASPYYDLQLTTKKTSTPHIATIKVTGKGDYHCNTEYRWKLSVQSQPGVTLGKKILKNGDAKRFTEEAVVFEVPYTSAPKQKVSATLKFSVCNDKLCLIEKVPLTW